MHDTHTTLDPDTLAQPITGRGLAHATLAAELGASATALVFLRHYG
jgi:hypothetical protein